MSFSALKISLQYFYKIFCGSHCEVHNETYKPGKSIKYNEQHLKKWKCNEHLWRKDNEHVEVKTIKHIQQNNVNGWQNLENYRKLKTQWKTLKTRRKNVEKTTRKNNATHWKRIKKQ